MSLTLDEVQKVVEVAVSKSAGMNNTQILLLVICSAIASFIGIYLKEKAKGTATKEDIAQLTEIAESVKKEIEKKDRIGIKKYELKYNACTLMLNILDAHLSHVMKKNNDGQTIAVDKQYSTTAETRTCHNELLLTIDDQKIISLFMSMMTGNSQNIISDLDNIRKLVRKELGFGEEYHSDSENTWLAVITCKEND